ncbi:hypothetical protein GCM10009740_16810 [Terrabacter terrae]|uniref:Uncharacterized protein n=1 Tax=Terrabacter terrae TaxID=318434 RepID=A0ABN2U3F3_9MICO
MTNDSERRGGHHDGWGAAAIFLIVLALLLGVAGGLVLLAMVIAPPLGPEDEISNVVWTVPLGLSMAGIVVALVGRSALIQTTLAVFGVLLIMGSVLLAIDSAGSPPVAGPEWTLNAVPLIIGFAAIGLCRRDRRLRHRGRAAHA